MHKNRTFFGIRHIPTIFTLGTFSLHITLCNLWTIIMMSPEYHPLTSEQLYTHGTKFTNMQMSCLGSEPMKMHCREFPAHGNVYIYILLHMAHVFRRHIESDSIKSFPPLIIRIRE